MTSVEISSQEREGLGPMGTVFSWLGGPTWNIDLPVAWQIQDIMQTWLCHFPRRELISGLRPLQRCLCPHVFLPELPFPTFSSWQTTACPSRASNKSTHWYFRSEPHTKCPSWGILCDFSGTLDCSFSLPAVHDLLEDKTNWLCPRGCRGSVSATQSWMPQLKLSWSKPLRVQLSA